ncbi:hypothetical protein [Nocardiopsis baichengensis]|uniref:hypothetical protein n=1 Tax=Nocardiopsis baichengensis TaxID=280240 RepID=UPI000377E023|nr:hypothetical protein [Nocardiopsis baichengensis]
MPHYRGVVAVDTEKASLNASLHQRLLSGTVPEALEEAFRRSGLEGAWERRSFPQRTGDGYLMGVSPENLPLLVDPFLGELQGVLGELQPGLAFEDRGLRLRLRASIGVGPLPDSGGPSDGIGAAMNDTHRLLDSPVLRAALADSDPDTTHVVAGVTRRVFEDAVLSGYCCLAPRRFTPVDVDLPEKRHRAQCYLYTPVPSLLPSAPADTAGAADRGRERPRAEAARHRPPQGTVRFEAVDDA